MKKFLPSCFIFASSITLYAQQDPLYSQYFNNPMLINPAFAGNNERLYAGLAYRSQWTGITGSPTTFNFNSHIAMTNDNRVGVGMLAVQDQIGDIKNTQLGATGAYRIKFPHATSLSFGMQMGITRYATDPNAVKVQNNPDPAFYQFTETKFNTGAGLLLQSDKYLVSFSVPRILANKISQGGESIQVYSQNFYLYGSYNFFINEHVEFKPSTLLRMTKNSTSSIDLNCNFTFYRLYTAGVFTRNFGTYGLLVQAVMSNYRFGYIYEVPGKNSSLNFTTHEVSLALSLDVLRSHNHSVSGF